MKKIVIAVALVLFGVQIAVAQISTSVEMFPIGVNFEQAMATPDYFTVIGNVAVYSFAEFVGDGSWFTNHSATWSPTKYLGLYAEASINDVHDVSTSIGPAFSIPLPGFVYFKMRPTAVIGDLERTRELNLVWKSKSLPAFGGEIWTEGFIRTLRDAGNTYGQPQVWWRQTDSTWHFGVEVEISGSDRTLRGGLRKTF